MTAYMAAGTGLRGRPRGRPRQRRRPLRADEPEGADRAHVAVVVGGGYYAFNTFGRSELPAGIAAATAASRPSRSMSRPGFRAHPRDRGQRGRFVTAGQVLARMDTDQLEAQRRQAEAQRQRATIGIETAKSLVAQREAERTAAIAVIAQREAQLDAMERKLARSEQLIKTSAVSQQVLDDDRANAEGAKAAVAAASAQLAASEAAVGTARAQIVDAEAAVDAARAAIESITADINRRRAEIAARRARAVPRGAARRGAVRRRARAQPGRFGDVYMTFFLSTAQAAASRSAPRRASCLDAAPKYVIPARCLLTSPTSRSSRPRRWRPRRSG